MRVVLYSRRGCHLCERAEDILRWHAPAAEIIDIDSSAELAALYGLRVPVIVIDGKVVLEGRFDESALLAALGAP
jgi:glutaredoxin